VAASVQGVVLEGVHGPANVQLKAIDYAAMYEAAQKG
jgi:hypothetical protein